MQLYVLYPVNCGDQFQRLMQLTCVLFLFIAIYSCSCCYNFLESSTVHSTRIYLRRLDDHDVTGISLLYPSRLLSPLTCRMGRETENQKKQESQTLSTCMDDNLGIMLLPSIYSIFYTKPICGVARKRLGHHRHTLRYHHLSPVIYLQPLLAYWQCTFPSLYNQPPPVTNSKQVSKRAQQVLKASYKWLFSSSSLARLQFCLPSLVSSSFSQSRSRRSSSNGPGDKAGFSACGGHLQLELLLHVPHGDAPVPRARGEPDGGGAGPGPQGEGDGQGTGEVARPQPRSAGGVHRRQARRLHRQGHVASPQRQPRPASAQCWRALGVAQQHSSGFSDRVTDTYPIENDMFGCTSMHAFYQETVD